MSNTIVPKPEELTYVMYVPNAIHKILNHLADRAAAAAFFADRRRRRNRRFCRHYYTIYRGDSIVYERKPSISHIFACILY